MDKIILKIVRILLGWTFLWAFFDKLYGLGFATSGESAWVNGVSPTYGFLTHATKGPFAEIYQMLAGQAWVDWLFMLGLLLIGISMIAGIGVKYSAWAGALLMLMMYTAGFIPPEHNPIVDEHLIYVFLFIYFAIESKKELKE
jgi:thiosulfate dehydrogenase [quinone] large subunit